jgi:hypothetical protein
VTATVQGFQSDWHLGNLQRRTLQSMLTAAFLIGLYGLYSQFVSPLVLPPAPETLGVPSQIPMVPLPRKNRKIAEQFLQLAPWATTAKYQLRTDNAFVYAQTSEPNDAKDAIQFTPFAVVWMQKGKRKNEAPYVIISDKAYIKFSNSFEDLFNSKPVRVIGGTFEGEVRISRSDVLKILGKDFRFSEESMSIWSDNPVEFAQGPHLGRAIGLDAQLIPDEVARAKNKFAVAGVKSVRLQKQVVMDLLFDEDFERKNAKRQHELHETQIAQRTPKSDKDPDKVRIQSQGSFTFGVDTYIGTFVNDVQVYRPTEPGKYDTLFSDKLTLIFEPESPHDNKPPQASLENAQTEEQIDSDNQRFQSIRSDLTFRSLHAEGSSVVLISQSNNLDAQMNDLVYDIKTKVAVLTDANFVKVRQKGQNGESIIHSPSITLAHDQKGTVSSIWCKGKGGLRTVDTQSGQRKLIAQWNKQMRKYPDKKSGLDIVDLEDNATLIQPEQQISLAAEFIRFWIKKNEFENLSQFSDLSASPQMQNTKHKKDQSEQYELQRLVAERNVTMNNKDMHARTKRLEADFEQHVTGHPQSNPFIGIENKQRRRSAFQPTSYREEAANSLDRNVNRNSRIPVKTHVKGGTFAERQLSQGGLPTHFTQNRARSGSAKLSSKRGPMDVTADSIRVRVLQGKDQQQAKIAEVWTNGNVNVRQIRTPGEAPLIITGNQMHVVNRSHDDQLIHVLGKPAHIRDPKMHIEGTNLHFDRGRNLAWVTGEGLLQLPVKRTLEGEMLDRIQRLDILWTEQMKFDGETAQFFGDVRTILNNNHVKCQEMYVLMTKQFSFTDDNSDEEAKISQVICKDNVDFRSHEYEGNQLIGVRRGRFADLTMDQLTGKTQGAGPGWMTGWRRGRGKRASLTPNATVKANSPLDPDTANWEYFRIDFSGKMNGNTKSRTTQFHDQVQIVYGPVQRSLDVLDPDNLPKDGGWMRSDKLRVTQHEINPSPRSAVKPSSYIDMQAQGNAKLKGRKFYARATYINYDESKGIYILRSLAPRKATMWRQTKFGGERSQVEAQRMVIWPARNKLKLDDATEFQGFK